jgi:hypothetical protein
MGVVEGWPKVRTSERWTAPETEEGGGRHSRRNAHGRQKSVGIAVENESAMEKERAVVERVHNSSWRGTRAFWEEDNRYGQGYNYTAQTFYQRF